jgi:hypothetical protein
MLRGQKSVRGLRRSLPLTTSQNQLLSREFLEIFVTISAVGSIEREQSMPFGYNVEIRFRRYRFRISPVPRSPESRLSLLSHIHETLSQEPSRRTPHSRLMPDPRPGHVQYLPSFVGDMASCPRDPKSRDEDAALDSSASVRTPS